MSNNKRSATHLFLARSNLLRLSFGRVSVTETISSGLNKTLCYYLSIVRSFLVIQHVKIKIAILKESNYKNK